MSFLIDFRFIFSQLDPEVPTKQFSFVLQVDKNDKYEICDCKPSVDAMVLLDVADRLNRADDYMYLARRMRTFVAVGQILEFG